MKTFLSCFAVVFLIGCASPNPNGIDAYSFIPGGSTVKHVKKVKENNIKRQVNAYRSIYDDAEYFPSENVIKVQANEESAMVSVDVLGAKEAVFSDKGWLAILFDIVKGAGYYFVAQEYIFDSGSSNKKEPKIEAQQLSDENEEPRQEININITFNQIPETEEEIEIQSVE